MTAANLTRPAPFPMDNNTVGDAVREVVRHNGRLGVEGDTLTDDADLYQAGLTSHATVSLMLALEDHFDVEFPESKLRRRTFSSIATLSETIEELLDGAETEAGAGAEGQG